MGQNIQHNPLIEHIYIHVPFCLKKCAYCSFYSEAFNPDLKRAYIQAILKEINLYKTQFSIIPKTIYFGGGTPSLLSADDINIVIEQFSFNSDCEITLEANPYTLTDKKIIKLSKTKINRISLGVQSLLNDELELLGRLHKSSEVYESYNKLRQYGFDNISVDLIYGLPNQTLEQVDFSLNKIIELKPNHISTYCLSLENNVPLFNKQDQLPSDEDLSNFYYFICNQLQKNGFHQYEISNFSLKNYESKHNFSYWNDSYYIGIGPGASGYLPKFRYVNNPDLKLFINNMEANKIVSEKTEITIDDHEAEYIFLALRTTRGLNLSDFKQKFGNDFLQKYNDKISHFLNLDFLEIDKNYIRLKPKAYFISNSIFSEFV